MDFVIIEKPAFSVVGKSVRVSTKDGENFKSIPEFWGKCMNDGTIVELARLSDNSGPLGNVMLGICADFASDMSEFTYMIAVPAVENVSGDGFTPMSIPALTWAQFESVGPMPDAIQAVWVKIFSEFFEAGEYVHGVGPDLELYPSGDVSSSDYHCSVWVPVVKK